MTLDLKEKQTQFHLLSLLKEVHERMYPMMEYCERLQPVKLIEDEVKQITYFEDLTDEEDKTIKTTLFRLLDPELDEHLTFDDQTSRSILKDLRKVIKSLEK
tara:strand:- start:116 stop:421 length:306 start_codon:yes stop_codon:yes gene_type:complete